MLPKIIAFVSYVANILNYPYVWALTENENMLFIKSIVSGNNIYQMTNVNSFLYYVYPPFFHLFSAIFIKLFGFNIFIPRLISVFSFSFLIISIWTFFKRNKTVVENILIAFLLMSASVAIILYSKYFVLARVDMLSYALAFWSLFFTWKITYCNKKDIIYFLLSGITAILAIFTKQSVFFPYIAIAFLIFFVKDRKKWLLFGLSLAAITGVLFFLMNVITGGGFLQNMLFSQEVYGKYLNSINHFFLLQSLFIKNYQALNLSIIFIAIVSFYNILSRKKLPAFSLVAMAGIYLNFLITGGNRGAEYNTLIPMLFGILLVMKELYFLDNHKLIKKLGQILFITLFIYQMFLFKKFNYPFFTPNKEDRQNHKMLIEILRTSTNKNILGDRIDYDIFLAGKESVLEASTHVNAMVWLPTKPYAYYVEKSILERIEHKEIDLAVKAITNIGNGNLLEYVQSKGEFIKTLKINYVDAPELEHKIYKL